MLNRLLSLLAEMSGASFFGFTYLAPAAPLLKSGNPTTAKGARLTAELSKRTVNRIVSRDTDTDTDNWITRLYDRSSVLLAAMRDDMTPDEHIAADDLLASWSDSKRLGVGNNPRYRHPDTFAPTGISGVSVNVTTGELSLLCLSHSNRVLIPARYNPSGPMSARDRLLSRLPAGKVRRFTLSNLTGDAKLCGDVAEITSGAIDPKVFAPDLLANADREAITAAGVILPDVSLMVASGILHGSTVTTL